MTPSTNRPHRVLIVDDEEPILKLVDRVLRKAGYQTLLAHSAAEALELAQNNESFDLLLTDLMMPGMSGDELARQLFQQRPFLKVIYLTGFSDRLFESRSSLWSNEAFVDKPVSVAALREAVSQMLFGHMRGPETTATEPASD
ncbi:MAG: response regulator [Vicinamibacterales bacterium]